MHELLPYLETPSSALGLATLVGVEGSSPRTVGSSLVLDPQSGVFHGSVSSGCVENVLLERLPEVIAEDAVRHLVFGPEETVPWAVGLTCGGTIRVRLERYFGGATDPVMREIAAVWQQFVREDEPGTLISRGNRHCLMMSDGSILGTRAEWPRALLARALELARAGAESELLDPESAEPVFLRVNRPRPRLFVTGAVHIAVELARFAAALPLRLVVIDPRAAYARPERFPVAPYRLLAGWPEQRLAEERLGAEDALVVLSHDSKIDDPALLAAVRAGCGYIGALGSQLSQQARRDRLLAAGLEEENWARIRGPVAAGLKSRDAGEIALGILREWAAWRQSVGQRPSLALA